MSIWKMQNELAQLQEQANWAIHKRTQAVKEQARLSALRANALENGDEVSAAEYRVASAKQVLAECRADLRLAMTSSRSKELLNKLIGSKETLLPFAGSDRDFLKS